VIQPYRVYIAAASTPDQIERVTTWANRLTRAGIAVVSTWPAVIGQVGATNPRDASVSDRRGWSAQDLSELTSADAIWLLCPPPGTTTRGAWVELGCAYSRALLIVSSGDTRQSIFTALGVEYGTDEDALDGLLLVAAGRHTP
jgi:hypothetical protein